MDRSAAREQAKTILAGSKHGAIGVVYDTIPMVTRVATAWIDQAPYILVSDLSQHTKALAENPACSLLVGMAGEKGDPMTHPRLTMQCIANAVEKLSLRDVWLAMHPKSKLYFDFADFNLLRLNVNVAYLNGGFGKAFHLPGDDLL